MNAEKLLELYIEFINDLNDMTTDESYDCKDRIIKIQNYLFMKLKELKRLMYVINPDNEYAYDRKRVLNDDY